MDYLKYSKKMQQPILKAHFKKLVISACLNYGLFNTPSKSYTENSFNNLHVKKKISY